MRRLSPSKKGKPSQNCRARRQRRLEMSSLFESVFLPRNQDQAITCGFLKPLISRIHLIEVWLFKLLFFNAAGYKLQSKGIRIYSALVLVNFKIIINVSTPLQPFIKNTLAKFRIFFHYLIEESVFPAIIDVYKCRTPYNL